MAAGAVAAGGIRRPTPERLPVGPLTNFGHTGEVALAVAISVRAAAAAGPSALVGLRGVNSGQEPRKSGGAKKSGTKIAGLDPGRGRAPARRSKPSTRRTDGYAGAWL